MREWEGYVSEMGVGERVGKRISIFLFGERRVLPHAARAAEDAPRPGVQRERRRRGALIEERLEQCGLDLTLACGLSQKHRHAPECGLKDRCKAGARRHNHVEQSSPLGN